MKMIMIICPDSRREAIRELIAKHDVHTFSELDNVVGQGRTGKHLNTRVWPGKFTLLFTVAANEKKDELLAALKTCTHELYPEESLHAFVMPVEESI